MTAQGRRYIPAGFKQIFFALTQLALGVPVVLSILSCVSVAFAQEVEPNISISGRVVDADTYKPIPSVTVNLFYCEVAGETCSYVDVQTVGQDGRFQFSADFGGNPLVAGTYAIQAGEVPYSTFETFFDVAEGEYGFGDIPLQPLLGFISGRVVDAVTGEPIPGDDFTYGSVELLRCEDESSCDFVNRESVSNYGQFSFITDSNGNRLTDGTYQVRASVDQYQRGQTDLFNFTEGERYDVDIPLQPLPIQSCVPPPSDMIAWWPGDGNADDIVGARHGSFVGSTESLTVPGIVGDAFRFDGSGWVEVSDDPIWTLSTEDFTIDLWVRFQGLNSRSPFIAHDDGSGEYNKWIFWYDEDGHDKQPGVPALRFHINSPHEESEDPGPVPFAHDTVVASWNPLLGQWYHVAVTRSGINYALYIDGEQVATDTSNFSIPDPASPLTIGYAEGYFLNGLVDEVEIFNRALSASKIQTIFNAGSAGKCKGTTVTIDIKPGSFPNRINPRSKGVIPVAILTTDTFDATTVDPTTALFGPTGTEAAAVHAALKDVDGDGDTDIVFHFRTQDTGIACGDTSASLTGEILGGQTVDGQMIIGTDSVKTVGCKPKKHDQKDRDRNRDKDRDKDRDKAHKQY